MQVRILFYCPRCGSVLFRPSISRQFRDRFLGKVGIHPQRCYMCRLRFYLFKPWRLKAFVAALDRSLISPRVAEPQPSRSPLEASSGSMVAGIGNILRR
jgi:hypothetical protein